MPILFQTWYKRTDAVSNPSVIYLFGDNEARAGYGGQAKEMRDEPNALGVATKRRPDSSPESYWSDATYKANCMVIESDLAPAFAHAQAGGIVVLPYDGLGTGLSELPTRAPRTNAYLVERLRALCAFGGCSHPMPRAYIQAPGSVTV